MILQHEPLARYTYMNVGGPADALTIVTSINELIEAVESARRQQQRYLVLGGGSNTIFTDQGFRGLVIINRCSHLEIDPTAGKIIAAAGLPVNALVTQANQAGLAGIAEFFGLPGTVGGAIYNNAHAQNKLIGTYVAQVEIYDESGDRRWLSAPELAFAYEQSVFQQHQAVLLQIEFHLDHQSSAELTAIATTAIDQRRQTQPLDIPSSGCMFQNPPGASAGALIDQAGLKGYRVGGAEVSRKHANFIVNSGNATAQDIITLSDQIIRIIQEKFNLTLKREVFILNEVGERIDA